MKDEADRERNRNTRAASSAESDLRAAPGRSARSASLRAPASPLPSGIVSSSGGAQLPEALRSRFETSLATDLSDIRVHTGSASADAARSVGARAFAYGNNIHFGAGHYDPQSSSGRHLIAHEVAHTVQQRGGSPAVQFKLAVSQRGDAHELEADRAASAMVAGERTSVSPAARSIQRDADEHLSETRQRAAENAVADLEDWNQGEAEMFDESGLRADNGIAENVDRNSYGDTALGGDFEQLMQQMDSLKPAIEAWKGVDAEVRSVATGNGLNLDTPEAYKKDLEAVYDAMQFDGSGNSNESNFSRDVSALMLDSEVADIEGAKGEASGARSDLESAEQVLKAAQARLDAFKAEEGKEGAEKELAAVKAKAKMIADIIGVVTKLATGVNAFNDLRVEKDAAKKASGQRKEGLALPGSLGGFLEAGVKAVVFGRQIDALSGRITAAQSQITSLNAAGLQADISGASASATAAATKMKAFDAKAKALQERYQARMEKIGRKFDRREVDDSTPKGKKQLEEQKGPMKASGASVSIEAVMSVYGGLQRRGAARETALAVLQQCPQIGNADAILERAMRLDGGNKYGRTDPLRTRTDEQLPSDLKPEWYTKQYNERVARQTQDSAALVSSVGFVQLVVAELEQDAGADAACEQGWAALVTTAMSGKK